MTNTQRTVVDELLERTETLTLDQLQALSNGVRKAWLAQSRAKSRVAAIRTDLRAGDPMTFTLRDGLTYHAVVKSVNQRTITAEHVTRPLGTPCHRWPNGVRVPAEWCRKTAFLPRATALTKTTKEQFFNLAMQLSPENLTCDGELSPRKVRARRASLANQWRKLEQQIGRAVPESEVWEWARGRGEPSTGDAK